MRYRDNRGSPSAAVAPSWSSPGGQSRVIMMELLGRGAHASPRDGCSVLEYASVLAGERWSARPQSVHPALADAADIVNDAMSDDSRRLLTPLAPWLLGTNTADPRTWLAITGACLFATLAWATQPDEPRLLADLDAARDWLAEPRQPAGGRRRGPWAAMRKRSWARHAIRTALLTVATADLDTADAKLCQVLVDCINACRHLSGEPTVDPRLPLAECPQFLAVESQLVWSPGCDWMELGYRPVRTPLPGQAIRDSGPADARKDAIPGHAPGLAGTWNAK